MSRLRCVSRGTRVTPSACSCETMRLNWASGLSAAARSTVMRRSLPQAPGEAVVTSRTGAAGEPPLNVHAAEA